MNTTEQFEMVLAAARRAQLTRKELKAVERFAVRVNKMRSRLDDLRARNAEWKLSAAATARVQAGGAGHRDMSPDFRAVKLAIYRP